MQDVTIQDIMKTQGTRLKDESPWDAYAREMETPMTADLASAVAEYAERRYEDGETSNQNKEALAEQKELSDELAKQYQWLTPEEYKDHYQRIGRVMTHAEFITTLRKAGLSCFYRQHPHIDKAVLVYEKRGQVELEVGCWAQQGQMPELSIMNFDDHGVPLNEKRRGWRTCLLQLILKGAISEKKANRYFGRPKQSEAFGRYNSTLQAFRNAGNNL